MMTSLKLFYIQKLNSILWKIRVTLFHKYLTYKIHTFGESRTGYIHNRDTWSSQENQQRLPEKMVIALKAWSEKAGREKGWQPIAVSVGQSTCKDPEAAWSLGKPRPKGGQVRLEQRTMGTVSQEETRGQATQSFVGHLEKFHLYFQAMESCQRVLISRARWQDPVGVTEKPRWLGMKNGYEGGQGFN